MCRLAVGLAFPAFTSSLLALRSILLFNRKTIRDTEVRGLKTTVGLLCVCTSR